MTSNTVGPMLPPTSPRPPATPQAPPLLARRGSLGGRRPSAAFGSPMRAAIELRGLRESGECVFPSLGSYEQVVGCIMESLRGGLSLEDFDRGIEAVKTHLTEGRRPSRDPLTTPTTACATPAGASPPVRPISRHRSYSSGKVTVSLTLDDYTCEPLVSPTGDKRRESSSCPPSAVAFNHSSGSLNAHGIFASRPPIARGIRLDEVGVGEVIGRGAMGVVYRGALHATGQQLAVKVVAIDREDPGAVIHCSELENELTILQGLDHPRIVRFLGHERLGDWIEGKAAEDEGGVKLQTWQTRRGSEQLGAPPVLERLVIFCEYMPGGSLAAFVRNFGPIKELHLLAFYTKQILEGIKYLHDERVTHRDVKGDNILFDLQGFLKLADFGCARKIDLSPAGSTLVMKTMKGSLPFMAPEILIGDGYGRPADIYAPGCVVIEMITGKHPWGGFDNLMQAMYKIAMSDKGMDLPEDISIDARNFISKCVAKDPKERGTAGELLLHPFITTI